jgi:hypothetical protein
LQADVQRLTSELMTQTRRVALLSARLEAQQQPSANTSATSSASGSVGVGDDGDVSLEMRDLSAASDTTLKRPMTPLPTGVPSAIAPASPSAAPAAAAMTTAVTTPPPPARARNAGDTEEAVRFGVHRTQRANAGAPPPSPSPTSSK